tara:strand:- start:284 stop:415 length:132 start_codon:yes stop_codon:yes gene_type:complete
MPKQSFREPNIDYKDSIRVKKQKDMFEIRKKLLKKNLKKRKKQ